MAAETKIVRVRLKSSLGQGFVIYFYSTPASYYQEVVLSLKKLVKKKINLFFVNNTVGDLHTRENCCLFRV